MFSDREDGKLMAIERSGSQPSQKAAAGHVTGTVRIDRSAFALMCCLALFGTASCGGGAQRQTKFIEGQEAVEASSIELRLEVVELARIASAYVEQAADAIRSESKSEDVRREALLWKVNAIPQIQAAALQPDPLVAPASRGRWRHLWSGEPEDEPESSAPRPSLEGRVSALEREVDELKRQLEGFRRQFE